jgi:hypothetical protein
MIPRPMLMVVLVGTATVLAADVPLDGTKLGIHERAGRTPKSDLTCRDASVALPAPGSAGDPSLGGATIEITIDAGGSATFVAPPGTGWKVTAAPLAYLYKNALAPAGGSSVKRLLLRDGKLVKVSARGSAVGATSPAGGASVRLTLANGDVLCARFPSTSIVKDQPGTLIAKNAPAPAFCSAPTTSSTSSTTTVSTSTVTSTSLYPPCSGGSAPACDGTCTVGDSCRSIFSSDGGYACICVPDGVPSCGSGYPTCGGACNQGNVCIPFRDISGTTTGCGCTHPDAVCGGGPGPGHPESMCSFGPCGAGFVCAYFDTPIGLVCGCDVP